MPRAAVTGAGDVIAVAIVDDHPAVRAGLEAALAPEPGIVFVGAAAEGEQLGPMIYRVRPTVVVLDYGLPRTNGLMLCRRLKSDALAPAVVVYSAYADAALVVPAIVAGADALVDKSESARELFGVIRSVARGDARLPSPIPELLAAARDSLDADDVPILDLLLQDVAPAQIATMLGLDRVELERRLDGMLERLSAPVGARPRDFQR